MSKCCCEKYDVTQEEDFIMNNIQHQMLGKVQNYHPFCGSVFRHRIRYLEAAFGEKDGQIATLTAETEKYKAYWEWSRLADKMTFEAWNWQGGYMNRKETK